jgi:RND family efflux transporter MFP subunit
MRRGLLLLLVLLAAGCSRAWYRRSADRETYHVIAEHADESRWPVARVDVTPPQPSRLFDPFNPDRPPMPPDDPAADFFMMRPNGIRGSRHFHDNGDVPFIEDPAWRASLCLNADGKLELTPDRAVELGILDSREYQTQLDNLYLTALALTLNRFEFDCHWFLTNDTLWTHFGSSATEVDTLSTTSTFGFTRNLYAGGQLLAEFANNFLITFSGVNKTVATSNLIATFTQPLLRGAGRWFRLEPLTQAERNVLYAVRDFARFRKLFYVNLTTTQRGGYLALLLQMQNVRYLEADLKSQEQNLRMHEALFKAESVSTIQVDQALQSYLQSRLALLQAQTTLETSLDNYKLALGLPPSLPVTLDDSLLKPFQLTPAELEKLQDEVERFFAGFRERDQAPTVEELRGGFAGLGKFRDRAEALVDQAETETAKAQLALTLAELDLEKYVKGEYKADLDEKQGAIKLAQKELQDAEEKLKHYQTFVKKGFGTPEQLRLKELEVEKARNYVERDKAKLEVLEKYTRKRQEAELKFKAEDAKRELVRTQKSGEANIAKARADVEAARVVANLEKEQLERFKKQLELAVIKAPEDGILVYSQTRYWDPQSRVQVGAMVMFQQPIFQLPELDHMQVKVRVHESKVKKIKEGQRAEIRVDAYANKVLQGTVKSVATLSDSADSWRRGGVKEYETIVTIDDRPGGAPRKPGRSAEVTIKVKLLPDVLLVPVQAVTEIEGEHFVYLPNPGGIERREVGVGESNEKFVEITSGPEGGEPVCLDARARGEAESKSAKPKAPADTRRQ